MPKLRLTTPSHSLAYKVRKLPYRTSGNPVQGFISIPRAKYTISGFLDMHETASKSNNPPLKSIAKVHEFIASDRPAEIFI